MKITAIFDGRCVICQATRRVVSRLDWWRRVEFVDLHDGQARARFASLGLDEEALMGAIHVVDGPRVFVGFAGTRRMLRELPLAWPVWLLLSLPGMGWLGAKVYGWIARHRYAVNRWMGVDLAACDEDGLCKLPQ